MGVNPKDEKAMRIRTLLDAYAIGVRGGVLTPCLNDEQWFRRLIGLDEAPEAVVAEWQRTNGIRMPITLQKELQDQSGTGGTKPENNTPAQPKEDGNE